MDEFGDCIVDPDWNMRLIYISRDRALQERDISANADDFNGDSYETTGATIINADYWSVSVFSGIPARILSAAATVGGLLEPSPGEELVTIPGLVASRFLSIGVTFTIDRFGNVYLTPGAAAGLDFPYPVSISAHAGNLDPAGIFGPGQSNPEEVGDFIGKGLTLSHGISGPIFPSIDRVWAPGTDLRAWEFGFGTPQINFATFSIGAFRLGSLW